MSMRSVTVRSSILFTVALLAAAGCGGDVEESEGADAPPPRAAQPSFSGASEDADAVEIQDYELTIEDVRRWAEAQQNLNRAAAANPGLEAALEPPEEEGLSVDASLDAMTARIEAVPEAEEAIEDAGLSPREYVVIFWSMFQTGMAGFALQEGGDTAEVAAEMGVNPDNVRFLEEHKVEIAALRRQLAGQ